MCIAIPMQVIRSEPGHAWVTGRGEVRRVDTALVGEPDAGGWLLVFLDTARERIDAARAAEVNGLLDLLQRVLEGKPGDAPIDAGFALPSRIDPCAFAAFAGQAAFTPTE
jgi:hydrogenase expression/formation protein HypC